jgi:hypothetical protein
MKQAEPGRRRKKSSPRSAPDASQRSPRSIDGNQGEGNREADRRYREAATAFARSDGVKEAAQEALRAIEEDERIQALDDDVELDGYDDEGDEAVERAKPGAPSARRRSRPS